MIRIKRPSEPPARTRARNNRLPTTIAKYNAAQDISEFLTGYASNAAKRELYLAQKKKCAWCELRTPYSSSPVEHYRPKKGAFRHLPGSFPVLTDPDHYWWLTWTWTNLLFSCARCNDQKHKGNYFPLAAGTAAVPNPGRPIPIPHPPNFFDVTGERPLLLDPADPDPTADPVDHIEWRAFETHLKRELWRWSPVSKTARGRATIEILRLAELADDLQDHIRRTILPSIEEVEGHLIANRMTEATQRWNSLIRFAFAPEAPLSAATWWALKVIMPEATRRTHGLGDPTKPGA